MPRMKVKRSTGTNLPLLFEAFEDFINFKEAVGTAPKTISNYEYSFRQFCEFYEFDSGTELEVIESGLVYKWMNTMKLKGYKPATINHYLRDLRTFLNWCMDEDRRYIAHFKVPQMKSQEEELKMFSDDELMALLRKPARSADFVELRMWAVVNFVLATGARAASVCSVVLGNLDFQKKEITFPHTKNKKAIVVPMSYALEGCLREYIRTWRNGEPPEAYLFCNISGEGLTTDALKHAFAKYCERRDVSRTNIHGLRHSFAKGWIRNGGDVFRLQQILGHSSLEVTRKYVRLFSEDLKEDYEQFSPLDTRKKVSRRSKVVSKMDF